MSLHCQFPFFIVHRTQLECKGLGKEPSWCPRPARGCPGWNQDPFALSSLPSLPSCSPSSLGTKSPSPGACFRHEFLIYLQLLTPPCGLTGRHTYIHLSFILKPVSLVSRQFLFFSTLQQCLLNTYQVPGTVLGFWNSAEIKTDFCFQKLPSGAYILMKQGNHKNLTSTNFPFPPSSSIIPSLSFFPSALKNG